MDLGVDGLIGWRGDPSYELGRWLFLRVLGAVFIIAFVSFWVQAVGLVGDRGVLPMRRYLEALRQRLGGRRWYLAPTVFWLRATDQMLHLVCGAGVVSAALLMLGVAPAVCLLLLWVLYLSLVVVGQDFMAFQWDVLLLEAAFFGIFLAPWRLLPGAVEPAASPVALVLLWWLLFRLTFQSGVVKLTSGDPTWRDLTALHYHYCTQPLPTWAAWYMHHTPSWFKKLSVLMALVLETAFPLLLFGPPEIRLAGVGGIVLLQLLIMGTGNYNFFNLLTMALALLAVHDGVLAAALPATVDALIPTVSGDPPATQTVATLGAAVVAFGVGGIKLWQSAFPFGPLPRWVLVVLRLVEPLRTINGYGLFRVMTTRRPEILIEGSADGATWEPYEFKWKPGDPFRRPRFVEPHQPRLDWQMWFAALAGYGRTPWLHNLSARLLEGSAPVLRLLRDNPFSEKPPRYVRTRLYDYWFTTREQRKDSGAWWWRVERGAFGPVVTLDVQR